MNDSSENRLEFRLQAVGRIIETDRLKAELQTFSSFLGIAHCDVNDFPALYKARAPVDTTCASQ
jgi:hypothetical protein